MITILQIRLGCTGLDKFFLKNICELKNRVIFIQLSQNKKIIVIVNGPPATESEYQLIYKLNGLIHNFIIQDLPASVCIKNCAKRADRVIPI